MKNPVILILVILTAFVLNMGCNAQTKDQVKNLKGTWKFILGDDMRFAHPNYNDSDWEDIRVPSSWEDEGFRNYDGYAWYRKTFEIDKDELEEPLFLHLGNIDDVDEVFFNGERIGGMGSFPPEYISAWAINRTYPIPVKLFNKNGKNVIAIRVYDDEQSGGLVGWNIGVYNFGGYGQNSISLMGQWKVSFEDNENNKLRKQDDSDWDNIMVPFTWESQGYQDFDGIAWYRKTFELPSGQSTSGKILILGKIDDIDETYVNGIKVGGVGEVGQRRWSEGDEYDRIRTYYLEDHILREGKENVVAVRVYDYGGVGGIYEGPITIIDAKDYKEFWRSYYRNSHQYHRWIWTYFED
ncbi:MAG: beta galactosidase jelly roll domain-containing protein [Reichenbachiella sp.]